jgi:SAM-dependent methyltransferase
VVTTAERFDAIYANRLAAGHSGWTDRATATEIRGHLAELLRHAGQEPGELLELGCGTGTLSFTLAALGYQVTGIDISATAIRCARRRAQRMNLRASFFVHDVRQPYAAFASRFVLVVDGLVLHYLTTHHDRLAVLRLASSSLRPGGVVLVVTMCGDPRHIPPGSRFDTRTRNLVTGTHAECHYANPGNLDDLFREAGMSQRYHRIIAGSDTSKDQDLYLAVLRPNRRSAM